MDTITLHIDNHPLEIAVYKPTESNGRAILYYHGGGFVFGDKNDLPALYRDLLLNRGYTLLCFDYPLAPEVPLTEIVDVVYKTVRCVAGVIGGFKDSGNATVDKQDNNESSKAGMYRYLFDTAGDALAPAAQTGLQSNKADHTQDLERLRDDLSDITSYILFGRSAGAYLICKTAALLMNDAILQPAALLSYYGFYDVNQKGFGIPNKAYAKMPSQSPEMLQMLISDVPLYSTRQDRVALYIYGQKEGKLYDLWKTETEEKRNRLSITMDELRQLPPTYLCASAADYEVPYGESKRMMRAIGKSSIYTVYDLPHDFDRDTTRSEGLEAYKKALDFLDSVYS